VRIIKTTRNSRGFDDLLLVAALLLALAGTLMLRQPAAVKANSPWLWGFFVLVCAGGGIALRRMDRWLPEASALPRVAAPGSEVWRRRGWLCLAAAVLLCGGVVIHLWPDYHNWHGTVLPWLLSLMLVIAGSHMLGKTGENKAAGAPANPIPGPRPDIGIPGWVEITAFVVIAALAVFLRVYRLDSFPPGIYVDETNGGLDALRILEGNGVSPFATGWYETPNGYIYYMAGMFKLFGANWYTLKAISLIPAFLTVLAVYPLGRMMFGPLAGMAAMLFMAVSRWHLSMSRFGWNETAVPLFQILATTFLLRGLRERRFGDFAIGGLLSGLMVYTYLSSRLALATLGVFVLYWVLADPEGPRKSVKRSLPGMLVFSLALLIAVAPLAVTYITDPFTFSNRMSEISIFSDIKQAGSIKPLLLNIEDHLRSFHQLGDHQGKHNLPGEPETDPVTGALFGIGLAYGAIRLKDRRRGLLWLWLLFGMAGGVFSSHHESPQSYRTLTALPAVTLLAGDVLSRVSRGARRVFPTPPLTQRQLHAGKITKMLGVGVFVVCLLSSAAWESSVFITRQMTSPQVRAWFNPVEYAVATEVVTALKANQTIYLSPNFYTFSPMQFLVYGYIKPKTGVNTLESPPYRLVRPEVSLPISDSSQDAVFLLDLDYSAVINTFSYYYPHARVDTVQPVGYEPLYFRVIVPRDDLKAVQGLKYTAQMQDGQILAGETSGLTAPLKTAEVKSILWQGSLLVEKSDDYAFTVSPGAKLILDGIPWNGERFLCRGLHAIEVQSAGISNGDVEWMMSIHGQSMVKTPGQLLFKTGPIRNGLTTTYYNGADWQGSPVCTTITPFILLAWQDNDPIEGEFSARFSGKLRIEKPGEYRLNIDADDGARLILDGNVLGESLKPGTTNQFEAVVNLSSGDHPIQIDYFQTGGGSALEFRWQPPGEPVTIIPMGALLP